MAAEENDLHVFTGVPQLWYTGFMQNMTARLVVLSLCCMVRLLVASIEPVSPVGGEAVALLSEAQRDVISLPTFSNRVDRLKERWLGEKLESSRDLWGRSRPLEPHLRGESGACRRWPRKSACSATRGTTRFRSIMLKGEHHEMV